jgi:hypothetical protein
MVEYVPSQCYACERKLGESLRCEAYPDGIPEDMLTGGGDHRLPRAGDNGKQFLLADAPDAEQEFGFWAQVYGP